MKLGSPQQISYVTADLGAACELMKERYGLNQFWRPGVRTFALDSGAEMTLDVAHAWIRETWIEIIQPVAGDIGVFRDDLTTNMPLLRVHHFGFSVHSEPEWEAVLKDSKESGIDVVFSFENKSMRVCYLDTKNDLGHYLEYFYVTDPDASPLLKIPQNRD